MIQLCIQDESLAASQLGYPKPSTLYENGLYTNLVLAALARERAEKYLSVWERHRLWLLNYIKNYARPHEMSSRNYRVGEAYERVEREARKFLMQEDAGPAQWLALLRNILLEHEGVVNNCNT